jgi:hypothetical protein
MRSAQAPATLLFALVCAAPGFCRADAQEPLAGAWYDDFIIPVPPDEAQWPPPMDPRLPKGGDAVAGPIRVKYNTAWYKIQGRVTGNLSSHFDIVQTDGWPLRASTVPGPRAIAMEPGGSAAFGDTWSFDNDAVVAAMAYDPQARYLIRFTYHHGYNSVTAWRSAVEYTHRGKRQGTELDAFGPKAVVQGGHFTREVVLPGALVPRHASAFPMFPPGQECAQSQGGGQDAAQALLVQPPLGATAVGAHRNVGAIPMGDSYLQSVELFRVRPRDTLRSTDSHAFKCYIRGTVAAAAETEWETPVDGAGLVDHGCEFAADANLSIDITCEKKLEPKEDMFYPMKADIDAAGGKDKWIEKKWKSLNETLDSIPDRAVFLQRLVDVGGRTHVAFVLM